MAWGYVALHFQELPSLHGLHERKGQREEEEKQRREELNTTTENQPPLKSTTQKEGLLQLFPTALYMHLHLKYGCYDSNLASFLFIIVTEGGREGEWGI